jgi:hypothetical protein
MSASDLAIVAALVFAWGMLSARLERFDVTAPITFVLAGALLTHGPLAPLGFMPSHQLVKSLAEVPWPGAFIGPGSGCVTCRAGPVPAAARGRRR